MSEFELQTVVGGAFSWNSTALNAISRGINTILDLGRTFGTSLRMMISGRKC